MASGGFSPKQNIHRGGAEGRELMLTSANSVLLKLKICAARANFPPIGDCRIGTFLPPRRKDAKRQAQGLSSRAKARDLGKISLFVRNDNALPCAFASLRESNPSLVAA